MRSQSEEITGRNPPRRDVELNFKVKVFLQLKILLVAFFPLLVILLLSSYHTSDENKRKTAGDVKLGCLDVSDVKNTEPFDVFMSILMAP